VGIFESEEIKAKRLSATLPRPSGQESWMGKTIVSRVLMVLPLIVLTFETV
jgi:hypothetical protein